MDKPSGLEYLLDWLGLDWPEGDEYKMWDLADYWHDAANDLSDIDSDIDAAISAVRAAYPEGSGGEAMIKQLQSMRSGPQAIDQLISWFKHVGDSASASGDSIQGGKIQFETLLLTTAAALLAEEAFPPTAPEEQAATIALSRVGARLAMRQLLKEIAENGLKDVLMNTLKNQWKRLVMHLVLDACIPSAVDLGNQEAKVLSGHQDGIHWGDIGKTAVEGLAGGLAGGFAGGLMQGWMRNLSSGMFRNLASGITGGLTGTLASGLTDMALTGQWEMDPSAFVAGGFWGAHGAMTGHHGTVEDGSAPHTRLSLSDEGGAPGERVPPDGVDRDSAHLEPTSEDSDPGRHSTPDPSSTPSDETRHDPETPRAQDNPTTGRDHPAVTRSVHETSPSDSGPKVHPTDSGGVRPNAHAGQPVSSHGHEIRSRTTNLDPSGDQPGPRADNAARPGSPIAARSAGSAGDGVRASGTRPAATGDGSSPYRPTVTETRTATTESPETPATSEPSETSQITDPPAGTTPADKPFSSLPDQPASEAPAAADISDPTPNTPQDPELAVPNDISGIDTTPAPTEPALRSGPAPDTPRTAEPERPSTRPDPFSPLRARSTGTEPTTRTGDSDRPTERPGTPDRTNGPQRSSALDGGRARGENSPRPGEQHPFGDNESHRTAHVAEQHRTPEVQHTSQEHHAGQDDYAFTGGAIRPVDDARAFAWADDAYDVFRGSDRDIDDIAGVLTEHPREDGTHFTRDEIAQIKNHLFREEHPIRDYDGTVEHRRYDADPDIAEAWIRLRSGDPEPADLVLLEHELRESNYYRDHPGSLYEDAHAHANENHNWSKAVPPRTGERYDTLWGRDGTTDLLQPDPQRPERGGVPVRGDERESRPGPDDRQGERHRPHGPTGGRDFPLRGRPDQAAGEAREGVAPERSDRLVNEPEIPEVAQGPYRRATLEDLGYRGDEADLPIEDRTRLEQALSVTEMVPPEDVRFTQRSVSRATSDGLSISDLADAMAEGGWRGGPVHAVKWDDGNIASLDNRRVTAARMGGLEHVPTALHAPSDRLEDWPHEWDQARRERNALGVDIRELPDGTLRVGGDAGVIRYPRGRVAETWGEIALFRAAEQRSLLPGDLGGASDAPVYAAKPARPIEVDLPAEDVRQIADAVDVAGPEADRIMSDLHTALDGVTRDHGLTGDPPALRGEDHRVKSAESLERKYFTERNAGESVPEFLDRVNDLVRFSVRLPDGEQYMDSYRAVVDRLERQGYEVTDVKNFWHEGNRYFGTNATLRSPDGRLFEVQFPTDASWRANKLTHEYYEVFRRSDEPIERRVHAFLNILHVNKDLGLGDHIPDGIDDINPPKDTGFSKWVRKNPDEWQRYLNWLGESGRDLSWVTRQFGMNPEDLVPGRPGTAESTD